MIWFLPEEAHFGLFKARDHLRIIVRTGDEMCQSPIHTGYRLVLLLLLLLLLLVVVVVRRAMGWSAGSQRNTTKNTHIIEGKKNMELNSIHGSKPYNKPRISSQNNDKRG